MPNHITNKIVLSGPSEKVAALIAAFSTHYERKPSTSHDGALVYRKTGTRHECGWLNTKTGLFTTRAKEGIIVSDIAGYEQVFNEAWTRFPDFEKIVPMPKGMDVNPHSGVQVWVDIVTGVIDFRASFSNARRSFGDTWLNKGFEAMMNSMSADSALGHLMGDRGNMLNFSDDELDQFVQAVKNKRDHGHKTWYDWSCENWGTKWNSYSCSGEGNAFLFDTAWNGVPDLVRKMSAAFPEVTIDYSYASEDVGRCCGKATFIGGEGDVHEPEGGSNEAYELRFAIVPGSADNYILVEGKYRHAEEEA